MEPIPGPEKGGGFSYAFPPLAIATNFLDFYNLLISWEDDMSQCFQCFFIVHCCVKPNPNSTIVLNLTLTAI